MKRGGRPVVWPTPTMKQPPLGELKEQLDNGIVDATDGCRVEPDGVCCHGHPSWALALGVI